MSLWSVEWVTLKTDSVEEGPEPEKAIPLVQTTAQTAMPLDSTTQGIHRYTVYSG